MAYTEIIFSLCQVNLTFEKIEYYHGSLIKEPWIYTIGLWVYLIKNKWTFDYLYVMHINLASNPV